MTRNVFMYSYQLPTLHALRDEGHDVVVLFSREDGVPGWSHSLYGEGLKSQLIVAANDTDQREELDTEGIELGMTLRRQDHWITMLAMVRETLTYASYLRRRDESRFLSVQRQRLPARLRGPIASSRLAQKILSSKLVTKSLTIIGNLAPVSEPIVHHIRNLDPDVTVVSPINWASRPGDFADEIEYVRASQRLGIPTVVPVYSWDNLTARGLYYHVPDCTLAWNQTHVEDATLIHNIPREKIIITGAPLFDKWYIASRLAKSREQFCDSVGLDPERPIVTYLGSSGNIAPDETWLIHELVAATRNYNDPNVSAVQFIIRPHPANADHYLGVDWGDGVALWPQKAELPDSDGAIGTFYNTLLHSIGTVGINTTGMIDAVVADKPSAVIFSSKYREAQIDTPHFHHLYSSGALERIDSGEDLCGFVERLLQGHDLARQQRRDFVGKFVRPRGACRSAGSVAASVIEMVASGATMSEIEIKITSQFEEMATSGG